MLNSVQKGIDFIITLYKRLYMNKKTMGKNNNKMLFDVRLE